MNRRLCLALAWTAAALSLVLLPAGCGTHSERYGLHELGVSPQQVHEVEPLDLRKAEPNEAPPEPTKPPEKLELSLPQSRVLALENNLQLKTALISPAIAGAQLSAEEAKFESSFFTNLSASKFNQPAVNFQGEIAGSQRESLGGDFGVQVPLRTGGTVTFDASDEWDKTNAIGSQFNPYFVSNASI
jgi:hypothetical protein